MNKTLVWYIRSPSYQQDLLATSHVWLGEGILGKAGMFLFLTYITLPILFQVQPLSGQTRSSTIKLGLLREQEKHFLQRTLGLSHESGWESGIANLRIRAMLSGLRRRHLQFVGMRQEYLHFFTNIIALAPSRIYSSKQTAIDQATFKAYWRYMAYASTLLGVSLGTELEALQSSQAFIDRYSQPDEEGRNMFYILRSMYPEYVQQAFPALFPSTRLVVQHFLEEV